jgi:Cu/Ag efflux protein CusF
MSPGEQEAQMSKKLVTPVAVAMLTALSANALAASQTTMGNVKSTDAAKHELTLANGDTFVLGNQVKLDSFKSGDKVAITFETKDGKMLASKIRHTK